MDKGGRVVCWHLYETDPDLSRDQECVEANKNCGDYLCLLDPRPAPPTLTTGVPGQVRGESIGECKLLPM